MKIRGCTIGAFGHFRDFAVSELDPGFVLIHGPNEAGKSTFFHFLSAMLFGLRPVDLSKHPYGPRDGSPISGRMLYVSDSGTEIVAERALRSTPSGRLETEGNGLFAREQQIRNQPLPEIAHITERVFRSVFALSLSDMTGVEEKAWETIQDRLLGGLTSDDLRPARIVVTELADDASRLWRPTRRGITVSQQLDARLRDLRAAAQGARESDLRIRHLAQELAELDTRLLALERRRTDLKVVRRRSDRLAPVQSALDHVARLRTRAGKTEEVERLPDVPERALQEMKDRIESLQVRAQSIKKKLEAARVTESSLGEFDLTVLENASQIHYWPGRLKLYSERVAQLEDVRHEVLRHEARVKELVAALLTDSERDDFAESLAAVPMAELRIAAQRLEQAVKDRSLAAAQLQGAVSGRPDRLSRSMTIVLALGIIVTITGLVVGTVALWAPGVGLVAFALGQMLSRVLAGTSSGATRARLQEADHLVANRQDALRSLLSSLPVRPERMEGSVSGLVSDFEALKSALNDRQFAGGRLKKLEDAVHADLDQLASLCQVCGVGADGEAASSVARLEAALRMAEKRAEAARVARKEREALEEELVGAEASERTLTDERDKLERSILAFGPDLQSALGEINERREASRSAEAVMSDLARRYPDWETLRDEISALAESGAADVLSDRDRQELEDELEGLESEIQNAQFRRGELQKDIDTGQKERSAADIESEIADVTDELQSVRREHDRLMLLSSVVRRADVRFRDRHQPDVLRLAGEYMSVLTEGRYVRLYADESTGALQVVDAAEDAPLPAAAPLSRGTLDQVYLAFRLALATHLDGGQERLPLFLDEVLVNWDQRRRRRAYALLSELSRERQVFYFTCHESLVRELAEAMSVEPVMLESAVIKS
jgi:uncharacterized protein YhaN